MADTADVIIIGGGIHGASLAFNLAVRGVKVIVLEKQFVGAGATGRSSGLVRMHYDTEVDSRLAWESFAFFRDWRERVGGECGFTRTGFIQIAGRESEAALRANVAMHQQIGIPSLIVTAADVRRLAPSSSPTISTSLPTSWNPVSPFLTIPPTRLCRQRGSGARGWCGIARSPASGWLAGGLQAWRRRGADSPRRWSSTPLARGLARSTVLSGSTCPLIPGGTTRCSWCVPGRSARHIRR